MPDNITNYLNTIKTASLGEEVRDSIYNSIRICYEDGQNAGSVDLTARESLNNLLANTNGTISETVLWSGSGTYSNQRIVLNNNPADYDYIYVHYKFVSSASPEVRVFSSSDFLNNPSILTSLFTVISEGSSTAIRVGRINIKKDPDSADNTQFIIYNLGYWEWTGSSTSAASVTVPSGSSAEPSAGTITKIVGVKNIAESSTTIPYEIAPQQSITITFSANDYGNSCNITVSGGYRALCGELLAICTPTSNSTSVVSRLSLGSNIAYTTTPNSITITNNSADSLGSAYTAFLSVRVLHGSMPTFSYNS